MITFLIFKKNLFYKIEIYLYYYCNFKEKNSKRFDFKIMSIFIKS